MTGVASSPDGYAAVGYLGGLAGPIEARFWWSPDGRSWSPATLDGDPAGTRVAAVERLPGGGFVAVGATGDARTADGSAAWTSPDGRAWTRVADRAALRQGVDARADRGRRRSGWSPSGTRRTAPGRSPGGRRTAPSWTVAPDAPSLGNFGLGIEMHDVAWDGTRLVAVGHRLFGTQYPTGVVWVSTRRCRVGPGDRIGRAQPGQDRGRRGGRPAGSRPSGRSAPRTRRSRRSGSARRDRPAVSRPARRSSRRATDVRPRRRPARCRVSRAGR